MESSGAAVGKEAPLEGELQQAFQGSSNEDGRVGSVASNLLTLQAGASGERGRGNATRGGVGSFASRTKEEYYLELFCKED